jgi:hypothetical protein
MSLKVLYIWFGENPLPIERQNAIAETMAIYPNAEYICITKQKTFIDPKFKCIDPQEIIEQMLTYFGLVEIPERWKTYLIFSEWARYFYIAQNPGTLYLDTDCRMLKQYDFENEKKVLNPHNEIYLIYSTQSGIAKEILPIMKEQVKKVIASTILFAHLMNPLWGAEMPPEYFKHK